MPVSDGRGLKAHVTTRRPRPEDPLLPHAVPPSGRAFSQLTRDDEMEGEEQNRRELHLPLSGRVSPFSLRRQRSSARRPPVAGHLLSAGEGGGGRLAPPGQSVFGKTQRTDDDGAASGRRANGHRRRNG